MGNDGRAAITAARMLEQGTPSNPEAAWARAIRRETKSSESWRKPCPQGAFLGLCKAGLIPGCEARPSLFRSSSGDYAVRMVEAIRLDPQVLTDRKRLWRSAVGSAKKEENSQIDIVVSLWREGIIE